MRNIILEETCLRVCIDAQLTRRYTCCSDLLSVVKEYNEAYATADKLKMRRIEAAIRVSMAQLEQSGIFDLFSPKEWITGSNEGRKMVGRLYQDYSWLRN